MKQILAVHEAPYPGWVGDGFPVRSLFNYATRNLPLSPFLLLDYAGPTQFEPTTQKRGVGEHPHRGFETVTIVYSGEVDHKDSSGGGGTIGPGDVQWMTAGAGVIHEEFHSANFAEKGGELEMVQLWVNLPAKDKMVPASYQAIEDKDIPVVELPDNAGKVRVIAGDFNGNKGAADTFSPVDLWDVRLKAHSHSNFSVANGHSLVVLVLEGNIELNKTTPVGTAQMAVLSTDGSEFNITAHSDAKLLVLSGQPLDEPVVAHGPFVMNTKEQINEAIDDFNKGRFGR